MRIKLLTSMAGADFSYDRGAILDVTDQQGKRYIAAGIAEAVAESRVEKAVKKTTARKAVSEE